MNELDVFKAMLQVGQGLPAYLGALIAGFMGSWVYLKKIGNIQCLVRCRLLLR